MHPPDAMGTLYYSLVMPYLDYCSDNTYKTRLRRVEILRNKAIRIINKVPRKEHITPHYKKLNILKIHDLVKYKTIQLSYKAYHKQLPGNIQMLFKPKHNAYNLRNDKQSIIEKSSKNIKYKSTTHNLLYVECLLLTI